MDVSRILCPPPSPLGHERRRRRRGEEDHLLPTTTTTTTTTRGTKQQQQQQQQQQRELPDSLLARWLAGWLASCLRLPPVCPSEARVNPGQLSSPTWTRPLMCLDSCKHSACTAQGQCCHDQCLGGCSEPGNASSCVACRKLQHGDTCLETCPPGFYVFKGWRCISLAVCQTSRLMQRQPFEDGRTPGGRVSSRLVPVAAAVPHAAAGVAGSRAATQATGRATCPARVQALCLTDPLLADLESQQYACQASAAEQATPSSSSSSSSKPAAHSSSRTPLVCSRTLSLSSMQLLAG
ncbi:hypothetical protein CRUP_017285 [Coryphaenoides rupestris]|nr:hypothetical protein CRUP_017285 [Coryphaenoides rupestris]